VTRTVLSHGRRIEVETIPPVAGTTQQQRGKRDHQHMGAPWGFWVNVCKAKLPWLARVLAIYIYRRTKVCQSNTVTLVAGELDQLQIHRSQRRRALHQLAAAGLVRLDQQGKRSVRVTLVP
jgi:hypothetical protein